MGFSETIRPSNLRIVYVADFYSEGMGHSENCIPQAMASLGPEVHLISSNLQVYGHLPLYNQTYGGFLGPARQPCGHKSISGYILHRLPHLLRFGYVDVVGLPAMVRSLQPDIVHCFDCFSFSVLKVSLLKSAVGYRLFKECHQHLSIVKPYLKDNGADGFKRLGYFATRTLPGMLASFATDRCFAISPDCAEVARRFYGVPDKKIRLISLGSDTEHFVPSVDDQRQKERLILRQDLGIEPGDILCIYTGRFTREKNPLLLAHAVSLLIKKRLPYRALFVGDGVQANEIRSHTGSVLVPFVPHRELPRYYRAADIAVWPTQESMSMLDAASCGIPIVASDRIGEPERVVGNGRLYREGSVEDLARSLEELHSEPVRQELGRAGRAKMVEKHSWLRVASEFLEEYLQVASRRRKNSK
jgi:glycosyltransferase involved in cell wall biosynthesis